MPFVRLATSTESLVKSIWNWLKSRGMIGEEKEKLDTRAARRKNIDAKPMMTMVIDLASQPQKVGSSSFQFTFISDCAVIRNFSSAMHVKCHHSCHV
jgi:hypothetical protein